MKFKTTSYRRFLFSTLLLLAFAVSTLLGQPATTSLSFTVSMPDPASQRYEVRLECKGLETTQTDLKLPVWMPGYYQVLEYPEKIRNFRATSAAGKQLKWEKANRVTWRVYNGAERSLIITYEVLANRAFVATNFLNEERGYIAPGGVFMHLAGRIDLPATVKIVPYPGWDRVATGLPPVADQPFTFHASNFDVLYDSPLLIGPLEALPSFTVRGVPHHFIGYRLGDFDHEAFVGDLKKVVEAAVDVIGEIPFDEYTFIGIGPGAGGIEHLNSTAVSFAGSEKLDSLPGRIGVLSFLGHEYFHHYNAKRIRPIELGPFDYDHGSRTNMLWVAEGITAYYDELLLRRAGLVGSDAILKTFERTIRSVENSPGRLFQSVTQASFDTWSDGPFGRVGDEVNKTVSYYQKGPVLGLLLDLKIRHETGNRKSLDDVMRTLYYDIYKKEDRGYTEREFREICEATAGVPLDEFFGYVYTVQPIDYAKYLGYAGLRIDLEEKVLPGATIGIQAEEKDGKLVVKKVEWNAPAWFEGIRRRQEIIGINGKPASQELLIAISDAARPGEIIRLELAADGAVREVPILFEYQKEIPFTISRMPEPNDLQRAVRQGWLME